MLLFHKIFSHFKGLLYGFNSMVKLDGFTKDEFQSKLKNGNHRFWFAAFLGLFVSLEALYFVIQTSDVYNHYFIKITRTYPATSEQKNNIFLGLHTCFLWLFFCETFETWPHLDSILYFTESMKNKNKISFQDQIITGTLSKTLLNYYHSKQRHFVITDICIVFAVNCIWDIQFYRAEIFEPDGQKS